MGNICRIAAKRLTLTGGAGPLGYTAATSARGRDAGERRDAGAAMAASGRRRPASVGSRPSGYVATPGQHLPDRGQATVTAGHVGGDRVAKSPRRSLVLALGSHPPEHLRSKAVVPPRHHSEDNSPDPTRSRPVFACALRSYRRCVDVAKPAVPQSFLCWCPLRPVSRQPMRRPVGCQ